jgi:hypothetical protein
VNAPADRPTRPYRYRFAAAYALLALTLVGAAGGGWKAFAASKVTRCVPLQASEDPIATAAAFIRTAVEREDPAGSYGLVTPPLRHGMTCQEWANGALPVRPFPHVDWDRASYEVTAGGTGQIVLNVTLVSREQRGHPAKFLLELRQEGARWLVGFWDRADHA